MELEIFIIITTIILLLIINILFFELLIILLEVPIRLIIFFSEHSQHIFEFKQIYFQSRYYY